MRPTTLIDRMLALHAAGLPLPPISGGDGNDDGPPPPDLGKLVSDAIARHGDQTSAMKAIISDLVALREDNGKLKGQLPAKDAVVLSGDDARDWGAYRQFGKPADLRKAIDEHKTLGERAAAYERDETLRGVAEKAKAEFAVLKTLAGTGLIFGEATVKDRSGKDVGIVTVKDGEAQPVPFDEYAAAKWEKFLPALKPQATTQAKAAPTPSRQEPNHRPQAAAMRPMMPRPDGVVVPSVARTDDKAAPDALDRHRAIVKGAF